MKYTKELFISKLKEKYDDPFEIIEYNGTSKKGVYKCGYCQKEYELARLGKLLSDDRKHICNHCFASEKAELVLDVFSWKEDLIFEKFSRKQNLQKPTVIYKCKLCGLATEKPYSEFLKYPTCIHCGKNAKRRTKDTIPIPEEFEILEEYENQYVKKLFRHECGFIFSIRPKDLITGHSYCPKCSKKASKGERRIIEYLTKENIAFEKEKIFQWSNQKRFDFFLPDYNLLVEYHGIQHYKEIPNFFLSLEEQQKVDRWKEEEARKRGFDFLVISYLDFENIENILAQRLKENT